MGVQALLGRLVVIGRDHEDAVGADLLGVLAQADRLGGGIGAGAGDHRHAAGSRLDHQLDHALVLGVGQGRRLAGGADRDQTVGPLLDVPLDQRAERRLVDPAIAERRD